MIKTDAHKHTMKAIREKEKAEKEAALKAKCQALAYERYGEEEIVKLSNANKGIWYLPVMDEAEENIEKLLLLKPIDRHILSYASTKINDDGLYLYLESCMRECFVLGDEDVFENDEYFIPAANIFNKIMETKKAFMVKR